MKLSELFTRSSVRTDFPVADKNSLLTAIIDDLNGRGEIGDRDLVVADVIERENVMSTGIGNGVAIPHAYTDGVDKPVAGFYRTAEPVNFKALDNNAVDLFFVLLGPKEGRRDHIKVLAKLSRLLNHDDFRQQLRDAADSDAVADVFRRHGDK